MGRSKRKGGRGKRTLNPDSIFWDSSSYRVVCKSWALASFRLLARHLGNAKNCQSLQYGNWVNFVKRNPYGKFLSRGACKDVFCVQNTKGELEAVRTFVSLYERVYVCVCERVYLCVYGYVYVCVCARKILIFMFLMLCYLVLYCILFHPTLSYCHSIIRSLNYNL